MPRRPRKGGKEAWEIIYLESPRERDIKGRLRRQAKRTGRSPTQEALYILDRELARDGAEEISGNPLDSP